MFKLLKRPCEVRVFILRVEDHPTRSARFPAGCNFLANFCFFELSSQAGVIFESLQPGPDTFWTITNIYDAKFES